ncbi:MAG TPA: winged helix-turn-helix domain-containing protein [Pyrinomonadaceae bacterium]|jgi:Tol biopolymer transport system component/DNA-binding winged helix-turn-helix (wHTH) protein
MSLSFSNLYEFGEFRLDTREKILMQRDQPVELTPKGFELLSVFVENHGRLLEKDELMDKIWADSFVEESNLTFNIRQLRKILGDDAHEPKYIKTVRRHGYRFIADVRAFSETDKRRAADNQPKVGATARHISKPEKLVASDRRAALPKTKRFFATLFPIVVVLLITVIVLGGWYVQSKAFEPHAPVLSAPFSSEKLSTNGKVVLAALSPDGKNMVYSNGRGSDKESLWLRQLDAGVNTEIIPPSDDVYAGLTFAPDGKQLYFVRRSRLSNEEASVYRFSIFGGIPQKIISGTEGWISISPDNTKISFVRCPHRDEENCSLWTADAADGKNERKLATRTRPGRIGDNRFSPDGKRVAFAAGQSENAANEFALLEIDLETGAERELTSERFFNIRNLDWLPDGSGWLLTASRIPNRNSLIWQVSASSGKVEPLTKDSEVYSVLSLDKEARTIVSTQFKEDFHLRIFNPENPSESRVLTDASSVSFAPDGKIYFSSQMSGKDEIWSMNPDGSGQRQLTNDGNDKSVPLVSLDNKSVYFASNRSGAAQVWRMNPDGSNQTQITSEEGGFPLSVSPDGAWVYYLHGINRTIWRVATTGGAEQMVLNKSKGFFALSPDGSQVAYSERAGEERILTIVALADGQTVKTFHLADRKSRLLNIAWMPDGKNLMYVSANREYENNVLWVQPLDAETPKQIASLGNEEIRGFGMSLSQNGKMLAVVQGGWLHDAVLLKGLK